MPKLTKRTVDAIRPRVSGDLFVWDEDLPGFGLRVKPRGRRTYVLQYRNAQGRSRRITLGQHGVLTPDTARTLAMRMLAEVKSGADPAGDRESDRKTPTVRGLASRYLTEHAQTKKKDRSVKEDQRLLSQVILPALGRCKVTAVTHQDVARLHHSQRERPYQANRALALLSKMFNLAERWGFRPQKTNPCRHVERYREKKRERYLTGEELARLGKVLAEAEREGSEFPSVITAIRLLLFTGARLSEILTLRWSDIDTECGVLRLADSKTGEKTIPLGAAALEVLMNTPHVNKNPYVCPGLKEGAHWVNMGKPWKRIRAQADLHDVRIHDLRHSFASVAAGAGLGLPVIGALLGHREAATTARYSHLAADPLKQAADVINEKIAAAMRGEVGKVIPIERAE